MAFGTGTLSFGIDFLQWTGYKLSRNAATDRTTLRIPFSELLNIRLRQRSADDPASLQENMLLTEVGGAGIQIGIGEGWSIILLRSKRVLTSLWQTTVERQIV